MLAVKRRPALLDILADDMPLTRSIRQRTEEESKPDMSYRSGDVRTDDALQLGGKDAHKGFTPSFALAADGSSAALCQTESATSSRPTDAAIGPAVLQLAADAAEKTSKQAQHGAKSGRAGASTAPLSERSYDSACQEKSGPDSRPNGSAPCCRISLPNEIQQSPRRTRSQNLSEADFSYLSSLSQEAHLRSSEALEGSQHQHSCGATPPPSSNTQLPKSVRVRHRRISLTLGATDGGATTSQTAAVTALKSCMRKESVIRSADEHASGAPALLPGSPLTRSRSHSQRALFEQDEQQLPQQAQSREGLPTRQSLREGSRRVRFAEGSLQDVYGTPDGHPSHEGQTARQRRSLNTSYPVDLTPHSIRMLEQELGESYRLSITRLKRRVGLLPRVSRPREYVTDPRPAPKPRQTLAGLPALRMLRSRLPVAEESDDSGDESYMHDSDSPTSSSTLSNDNGTATQRALRSTASSIDWPKAAWTANSGGVRHGAAQSAARSISGSRRKSTAPSRARPQSPLRGAKFAPAASPEPLSPPREQVMKKPPSPRTPRHGKAPFGCATSPRKAQQQLRLGAAQGAAGTESPERSAPAGSRAAGQAVPPIFQSPRKRPSSVTVAEDGAPSCTPRSPRRQRPLSSWNGSSLLSSMSNALKPSAALALPTPLPLQPCLLLRTSAVRGKAGDSQQDLERGSSSDLTRHTCQPESSAPGQQPAGSADMAKTSPNEAPGMGRRLRSADCLRQWDRAFGSEEAALGLRATICDSIMSHTRLLRSSSR